MTNATRKGAALGIGATGGLALAALLLPQVASALNPTKLGTALLATALALLTTGGQRLTERRTQRRALENALRVWPPPRLRLANLAALGVYPSDQPDPYRSRPEDAELRKALQRSNVVVIHGAPAVGKSRAASQAAGSVLGTLPVILPLNADVLLSLADGSIDFNVPESRICLWLDGLDRFVEVLDPHALQSLEGLAREVKIVATIRTEQWQELLQGTGQQSEAARSIAGRAEILELGPLDADAEESESSADTDPDQPPVRRITSPWRDRWLIWLGVMLMATLVVAVVAGLKGELVEARPIDEQMERIRAAALRGDGAGRRHVVVDERVRLHAGEADSWLLVVQDRPTHDEFYDAAISDGPPPRSDELRIYDVRDGRLRLALHFIPKSIGGKAAAWQELSERPSLAADYDTDGAKEVIAGYKIPDEATSAFVPFAIDWEHGRYRLVSLTPNKPHLSNSGLTPKAVRFRREAYEEPRTFQNAVGHPRFKGLRLTGYRVQTFAVVEKPTPRLLTGYFAKVPQYDRPKVLELHASQFRIGMPALRACTPTYYACRAPRREHYVIVPPDRSLANGLLEAWKAVGRKWSRPIRVTVRRP